MLFNDWESGKLALTFVVGAAAAVMAAVSGGSDPARTKPTDLVVVDATTVSELTAERAAQIAATADVVLASGRRGDPRTLVEQLERVGEREFRLLKGRWPAPRLIAATDVRALSPAKTVQPKWPPTKARNCDGTPAPRATAALLAKAKRQQEVGVMVVELADCAPQAERRWCRQTIAASRQAAPKRPLIIGGDARSCLKGKDRKPAKGFIRQHLRRLDRGKLGAVRWERLHSSGAGKKKQH